MVALSSEPPCAHTALPSWLPRRCSIFSPLLQHPLALAPSFLCTFPLTAWFFPLETPKNHTGINPQWRPLLEPLNVLSRPHASTDTFPQGLCHCNSPILAWLGCLISYLQLRLQNRDDRFETLSHFCSLPCSCQATDSTSIWLFNWWSSKQRQRRLWLWGIQNGNTRMSNMSCSVRRFSSHLMYVDKHSLHIGQRNPNMETLIATISVKGRGPVVLVSSERFSRQERCSRNSESNHEKQHLSSCSSVLPSPTNAKLDNMHYSMT